MMDKLKQMLGSRKVIMIILGVLYALLTVFKEQLGFAIDADAVVTALAVICVYIFGEAKADMAKMQRSIAAGSGTKWKEPTFWLSLVGSVLPVVSTVVNIPVATVNTVIGVLVGFLFKKKSKT